jgi:transcription termination factor Rho
MNDREQQPQQRNDGSRRRRRRPRRRPKPQGPPIQVDGFLWVRDSGGPLLVSAERNFVAGRNDPTVPLELISPLHLETGLQLRGLADSGDRPRVTEVERIEGLPPEEYRAKAVPFSELSASTPRALQPRDRAPTWSSPGSPSSSRPSARASAASSCPPPRPARPPCCSRWPTPSRSTIPTPTIFVLLVDERPEEVTDWKRSIARGEVFASSSDQSPGVAHPGLGDGLRARPAAGGDG